MPYILLIFALLITLPAVCADQPQLDFADAKWIWHPETETDTVYFRKTLEFNQRVERIDILISADASYEIFANGRLIGLHSDWRAPQQYEIIRPVARETTVIAIKAVNDGGAAGLICELVAHLQDGSKITYVTDETWLCSDSHETDWDALRFDADDWIPSKVLGDYPCQPWGRIIKEDWETLRVRLAERKERIQTLTTPAHHPQFSTFKGEYLDPEYAKMYRSFVKLDPNTGLLNYEGQVIRPFFTIYSQPKSDGGWILKIPEMDLNLIESDFARLKKAGIHIQPRFWSWSELLTEDGQWKEVEQQPRGRGLPYFKYVYEIYDYFLDRAQAHGLYVNIEPSYYWGLHPDVVPHQYRGKILLYNELWDATNEAYAKILNYFSKRTVITAIMVGEEDLEFDLCLDEPFMLDSYRRYLKRQYASISNLQRTWTHGYDFSDRTTWTRRTIEDTEVLYPEYSFVRGAFDSWKSFDDVRLPVFDYYRSPGSPNSKIKKFPTHQHNLIRDPSWIDFMEMREQMLVLRLNELADTFRSAAPNHILYYCNPHDFTPAWHMLHCFDRGKLRFDVIGVGQHDWDTEPWDVPHWATSREYIQNTASYAPYTQFPNGPKGFACGEGGGGVSREGIGIYYPWWAADIIGSGGAFFQSYDWNRMAGRTYENPTDYDEAALEKLSDLLQKTANAPFIREDAKVLILRSKNAAYGMSAGYDFANARYLGSILRQLHIPFDILPDSDVMPGDFEPGKINLNNYSFIFVPAQNQALSRETWQMLYDWISDPRFAGRRGLSIGLYQDQDSYFNPAHPMDVHPAFFKLTGTRGYTNRRSVSGEVKFRFARFFGANARGDELALEFPHNGELGVFDSVPGAAEKILEMGEGGPAIVVRNLVNGNPVFICGFYLGMAYDPVWGFEKEQDPYNTLNALYMAMLTSAGIEPPFTAPDNLAVYMAKDSSVLLVKERFGKETSVEIALPALAEFPIFEDVTSVLESDGNVRFDDFEIEPYRVLALDAKAKISAPRESGLSIIGKVVENSVECEISGEGRIALDVKLSPKTIYSLRQDGEIIKMFTTESDGSHRFTLDFGEKKTTTILITPT